VDELDSKKELCLEMAFSLMEELNSNKRNSRKMEMKTPLDFQKQE
jgi:hypothetical protein